MTYDGLRQLLEWLATPGSCRALARSISSCKLSANSTPLAAETLAGLPEMIDDTFQRPTEVLVRTLGQTMGSQDWELLRRTKAAETHVQDEYLGQGDARVFQLRVPVPIWLRRLTTVGSYPMAEEHAVEIVYTNYRGETGVRRVVPKSLWFGSTEWHPDRQWLLDAYDLEKKADRSFAMHDIRCWLSPSRSHAGK